MNWAAEAKNAEADLRKEGMAFTLRRSTPGTLNAAEGEYTGGSTSDYTCYGLLKDIAERLINGTTIQSGDKVATLGAHSLTAAAVRPKAGDLLIFLGETWTVIDPRAVEPGGVPLLYKVQIRRA